MKNDLNILTRRAAAATPQSLPIPGTVPNGAGGHAFCVDDWARLDRFLILGSEAGSYYASERTLTRDNAAATQRAIAADGPRAVARIVALSEAGRAPRNDPALLALALAASADDLATRRAALAALPRVARTGAHLLAFAGLVEGTRGWGRALRRAVAAWYAEPPVERLAYQLVKYRQRNGWSHRDLLRLAHPVTDGPRAALLDWVCRGTVSEALPPLVQAAMALARAETGTEAAALIRAHDLPREAVPTTLLDDPAVWEALLGCDRPGSLEPGRESPAQKLRMPLHALVRSLAKLTTVGVVRPLGDALPLVLSALGDADRIVIADFIRH